MSNELLEELEVLSSIYGDAVQSTKCSNGEYLVIYNDSCNSFSLKFQIPITYPNDSKPNISLMNIKRKLTPNIKNRILDKIYEAVDNIKQGVVMFVAIQLLNEMSNSLLEQDESDSNEKICISEELNPSTENKNIIVIHGPITEEQKSTFQSHMAVVNTMDEVSSFKSIVLSDKRIAEATHNILAYRFNYNGIVYHDYDDDGESAAGGRVAEMMRLMGVENVAVIITRNFGGTLLGPDRFKFICNSARYLLEAQGHSKKLKVKSKLAVKSK